MLIVLATMRGTALNKSEARVDQFLELTRNRRRLKQRAAFYIQAAARRPPPVSAPPSLAARGRAFR